MSTARRPHETPPVIPFARRDRVQPAPLPTPLTPLIGREREVAAVATLVTDPAIRLVTLTGAGGVGKTRLAIAAAAKVASEFADGVAYVPLAPLADADLVLVAIAQAIGAAQPADRSIIDVLLADLRDRRMLLVIDNLEHLLAATPALVALLRGAPRLTVLATSRVRLRATGEHVHHVPSLALPPEDLTAASQAATILDSPAVALFLQRARALGHDFVSRDADLVAIAVICRRLDGLPLAIELAAARVAHLPPPALLARLDPALPILTGGPRDRPPQQRAMRDAIAWSHDLLPPAAQALFRRLAVFAGGFTLEAIENVAAGEAIAPAGRGQPVVLDALAALIDANLVASSDCPGGSAACPRYAMSATVREYATERLAASGEAQAVRDAHAAWCLNLAETAETHLLGAGRRDWLDRIDHDHDNCRAALVWLRQSGDACCALRLAGAACHLWWQAGRYSEGRHQIEAALALPPSSESAHGRAKALTAAGALARMEGEPARAVALHDASLPLFRNAGDHVGLALAHLCLHQAAAAQGDHAAADRHGHEALAQSRDLGLPQLTAWALAIVGGTAVDAGDGDQAAPMLNEALRLARTLGDDATVARALLSQAKLTLGKSDTSRAAALIAEASLLADRGDPSLAAEARTAAGRLALARRDHNAAGVCFQHGLARAAEIGDRRVVIECLEGIASIAAGGATEMAPRLLAAADAARAASRMPLPPADCGAIAAARASAMASLGRERFVAAWAIGQAQSLAAAIAAARAAPAESAGHPAVRLTPRETEVLRLLVAGQVDREIAAAMSISRRTVQGHVATLFAKLGVHTRTAAATAAIAAGLVTPPQRPIGRNDQSPASR